MVIKPGKYIHYAGNEYEVIGTAAHGETMEEMVVYRALYGDGGLWMHPVFMWDEIVEYNGRQVKRFTHEDDFIAAPPPDGIHNHSMPTEKVELFLSYFTGRDDVFAKRYENAKKGTAGYVPACYNAWNPLCPKTSGSKIKCSDCTNQNFMSIRTRLGRGSHDIRPVIA